MKLGFDRSEPGVWLSAGAHAAVLGFGLLAFAAAPLPVADEGIPVEVVTDNLVSQITKGETTADAVRPDPKPRADRVAETRVERDPGEAPRDAPAPPQRPPEVKLAEAESEAAPPPPRRVADAKPEPVKPEPPPPPPSRPEPSRAEAARAAEAAKEAAARAEALRAEREEAAAEARAQAQAQAKAKADAEAKAELDRKLKEAADAKAKAEERARQVAEAKAKAEADAKAKAIAQAKAKAEAEAKARRLAEQADRFDPGDIRQLLASREPSQSSGATGREVQKTASLGTASGTAQRLNPSQRDQISGIIREQLIRCWQPPMAVATAPKPPTAVIRLALKPDGSLGAEPALVNSSTDPLFRPVADSALRATRRCAPLRIPAQFAPFHQDWKDLLVDFDPKQMT